uniref:Uncharacterized protein n=1 Tax=Bursaphelenchus xylophilus TaxID=6326 RepID=A0A1I7S291_BURXY
MNSAIIVLALLVFAAAASGADDESNYARALDESRKPKCRVHLNPALHVFMDRICVLCERMFADQIQNVKAECVANCFKSDRFRYCLNVFRPLPNADW